MSGGTAGPGGHVVLLHRKRQYIYRHCQLCHVTRSCAVIVGVCILMLPMLELATKHVQLATTYCMDSINHVYPRHMTFSHKTLVLPSLNNVLPAIAFENRIAWSSYRSTHSRVCHVAISPAPTGLGRRVVGVVVLLLLQMSGDIETNPGPVGEWLSYFCTVMLVSALPQCIKLIRN